MLASQQGHDEVVTTLLNCGANPDIQEEVCMCVGVMEGGRAVKCLCTCM